MATMTGVITSLRVAWGAQDSFTAQMATAAISDPRRPNPAPPHTLASLLMIPAGPPAGPDPSQVANDQWNKFCAPLPSSGIARVWALGARPGLRGLPWQPGSFGPLYGRGRRP